MHVILYYTGTLAPPWLQLQVQVPSTVLVTKFAPPKPEPRLFPQSGEPVFDAGVLPGRRARKEDVSAGRKEATGPGRSEDFTTWAIYIMYICTYIYR